jgi:hypothetical protein
MLRTVTHDLTFSIRRYTIIHYLMFPAMLTMLFKFWGLWEYKLVYTSHCRRSITSSLKALGSNISALWLRPWESLFRHLDDRRVVCIARDQFVRGQCCSGSGAMMVGEVVARFHHQRFITQFLNRWEWTVSLHIWTWLIQKTGKFFLTLPTICDKFWKGVNIWGTNSF